jgi:hypothetical protein
MKEKKINYEDKGYDFDELNEDGIPFELEKVAELCSDCYEEVKEC